MLDLGSIGVNLFFVLSGFLITGILLESKKANETKSIVLKFFYIRRSLRIFPIYYLVILLLLLFHNNTGTNIRSTFPYFLSYTQNFYFFSINAWDGPLSHLWSLAVEEQFYLIWPWVILFLNKKYLCQTIGVFISIGVFSQYIFRGHYLGNLLTVSCFDSFGLGALLSWLTIYGAKYLNKVYDWIKACAIVSIVVLILSHQLEIWVPLRTLVSIISLWLITYIIINYRKNTLKAKCILNNKVLIFLGK